MPSLKETPVHLGLGGRIVPQPAFTGMEWYADYASRNAMDGNEGRLISFYDFIESWTSWERHPAGDEFVLCIAGAITLIQEMPDGRRATTCLHAGEYAINPPGIWHTADIDEPATALFITAGLGSEHRQR